MLWSIANGKLQKAFGGVEHKKIRFRVHLTDKETHDVIIGSEQHEAQE